MPVLGGRLRGRGSVEIKRYRSAGQGAIHNARQRRCGFKQHRRRTQRQHYAVVKVVTCFVEHRLLPQRITRGNRYAVCCSQSQNIESIVLQNVYL